MLPNLQRVPPSDSSSITSDNVTLNNHNIYFYDDVATLRKEWSSLNTENVGELLIEFFRYFSKDFSYTRDVISIGTEIGVKPKDGQVWLAELCIEDPFQSGYNVARTVTRDGLYTIRGEFMRASRLLTTRTEKMSQVLTELCEEREDGLTRAPDAHYNPRHRSSFAGSPYNTGSNSNNNNAAIDLRYLRDLQRRYDLSSSTAVNGFGGSFAFEEMARGLGQAQKNGNMMVFPPTAAMLAPLSQNAGLSPRQGLMRAGLRYETPRRGPLGAPLNLTSPTLHLGSSARSEDGNNRDIKSAKSSTCSNVSAATSPTLDSAVASFLQPNSIEQNSETDYSTGGDGNAFGSEISFGSQRFQLHPHPSSLSSRSANLPKSKDIDTRAPRSFSDGVNRSMSMPRPGVEMNDIRRASTPLLSEPVSPLDGSNSIDVMSKQVNGVSLPHQDQTSTTSVNTGEKSLNKINGVKQANRKPSSSPQLSASPWSLNGPDRLSREGSTTLTPEEEESSFTLDDESASLSDIGDSISLATLPPRPEKSEEAVDRLLSQGKEYAVRSWAASQSANVHVSSK